MSGEQPDNTNVPPDTATQTQGMMVKDPADQPITPEMEARMQEIKREVV